MYNLQLPYKFDSHQFIMVEMVIMVEMAKVVEMVIMIEMVIIVEIFIMVIMTNRRDRMDKAWHLKLTFQVTCEGQLSQFLRCFCFCVVCKYLHCCL